MGQPHGQSTPHQSRSGTQSMASSVTIIDLCLASNNTQQKTMLQDHETSTKQSIASNGDQLTLSEGSGPWAEKSPRPSHTKSVHRTNNFACHNITTLQAPISGSNRSVTSSQHGSIPVRNGTEQWALQATGGGPTMLDMLLDNLNMATMLSVRYRYHGRQNGPWSTKTKQ